jgi:hypothetical protein
VDQLPYGIIFCPCVKGNRTTVYSFAKIPWLRTMEKLKIQGIKSDISNTDSFYSAGSFYV